LICLKAAPDVDRLVEARPAETGRLGYD